MQHESGSLNRFSQVHNKATTKGGSDMEVWKDIQGYEGLYQVSNLGNVRSLNWRNTGQVRNLYLKPQNRGYLQVELAKCGQKRGFTVHRLVAMAFVSGYAEGKVVNHINEDKRDNRAENLEWVSQSENTKYSCRPISGVTFKRHVVKGTARKCKTPVIQINVNGERVKEWASAVAVKVALGYSDWSIKQCCEGKRRSAYGYLWQYAT